MSNKAQNFRLAHAFAARNRSLFNSYREAFAASLKMIYANDNGKTVFSRAVNGNVWSVKIDQFDAQIYLNGEHNDSVWQCHGGDWSMPMIEAIRMINEL